MILIKDKSTIIRATAATAALAGVFAVYYASKPAKLVITDNRLPDSLPPAESEAQVSYAAPEASVKDGVLLDWTGEDEEAFVPEDISEIGEGSFRGLSNIKIIHLHTGIKKIGFGAFSDCPALESIHYAGTREQWELIEFDGTMSSDIAVIFDGENALPAEAVSDGEVLEGWSSDEGVITVPDGITAIGAGAFKDMSGVTEIIIPESVKTIGDKAFMYCTSLKRVSIPDSVVSLGSQAFYGCEALEQVRLSDELTAIPDMCFSYCSSLTAVTLPAKLGAVGRYAFDGCRSLEKVLIPEGSLNIGEGAFPEGVETVEISREMSAQGYNSPEVVSAPAAKTETGIISRIVAKLLALKDDLKQSVVRIPANVSVIRDNAELSDGDTIAPGDILFIKAVAPEGRKLYMLTVNGEPFANSSQYTAGDGDVVIKTRFVSTEPEIFFPEGVSVIRSNSFLSSGQRISAGDELFIKAVAPEGYVLSDMTINGESVTNSSVYTVDGNDAEIAVDYIAIN